MNEPMNPNPAPRRRSGMSSLLASLLASSLGAFPGSGSGESLQDMLQRMRRDVEKDCDCLKCRLNRIASAPSETMTTQESESIKLAAAMEEFVIPIMEQAANLQLPAVDTYLRVASQYGNEKDAELACALHQFVTALETARQNHIKRQQPPEPQEEKAPAQTEQTPPPPTEA